MNPRSIGERSGVEFLDANGSEDTMSAITVNRVSDRIGIESFSVVAWGQMVELFSTKAIAHVDV